MKYHATNFPHLGVYSSCIVTLTSLTRILHSKFQHSDYASDGNMFVFTLSPSPGDSSALQTQIALSSYKAIQRQYYTEEKKICPLMCVHNTTRTTPEL